MINTQNTLSLMIIEKLYIVIHVNKCISCVFSAQQMLLLCQGMNGVRKEGESVVWNHHRQSFQGESLTVTACPQTVKLIQFFFSSDVVKLLVKDTIYSKSHRPSSACRPETKHTQQYNFPL